MREIIYPILSFVMYIMWVFPIKKNRIVFQSYYGNYYNDNPKAVSDALKNQNYELVWIVNDVERHHDDKIKFVKAHSLSCIYYLATANVWIDNCRKAAWIRKRQGQFYIQLWHGLIMLKMVEGDAEDNLSRSYILNAKNDSRMADLMISNSLWTTKLIKRAFWYEGKIIECGTPRLDQFFSSDRSYSEKCDSIGLDCRNNYILYAPTFRNGLSIDSYDIDFENICKSLEGMTQKKWIILFRLHPSMSDFSEDVVKSNSIINMTSYPNIYDLLDISKILITDYSSCMFEAGFLNKFVLLYCNDLDEYVLERKLYFEVEKLPYLVARNNDELIDNLKYYESEYYQTKLNAFNEEIKCYERGDASNKIAQIIKERITII